MSKTPNADRLIESRLNEGLSKGDRTKLIAMVKTALMYRAQGNVPREDRAYHKIQAFLDKKAPGQGAGDAIEQGREYLLKTGWVAGSMQGWI